MNPTVPAQPLTAVTGLHRAPRTSVSAQSSADPPRAVMQEPVGAKPARDSVTISDAARMQAQQTAGAQPDRIGSDSVSSQMSRAQQILADLKAGFHTQKGDDGYNAKVDFNQDGVINVSDLGLYREKMAGGAVPPAVTTEPAAAPTLDSIRDAFFKQAGDDGFDAAADLNGDGIVNVQDLGLYRQSQASASEPTQPVPAPMNSAATTTVATSSAAGTSLEGTSPSSPVMDGTYGVPPQVVTATAPQSATTAVEASGPPKLADPSSTRLNLLDQLREAFFSRQGEDRFDAALDANNDGIINVGDFIATRDRD